MPNLIDLRNPAPHCDTGVIDYRTLQAGRTQVTTLLPGVEPYDVKVVAIRHPEGDLTVIASDKRFTPIVEDEQLIAIEVPGD
jgi:hypothetical protein